MEIRSSYKNDKRNLNIYNRLIVVSFYSVKVNNSFANLILKTTKSLLTQ